MSSIRIPEFPADLITEDLYDVTVNGMTVQVLPACVSAMPFNIWWPGHQRPLDQTETAGFITFEADGKISVSVKSVCHKLNCDSDIKIRPLSEEIHHSVSGDTIDFVLPGPGSYTLEIDGFHQALHIFVNPLRDFIPGAGRNVIEYGPGIHHIGHTEIGSHTTVIIDPAAIVFGSFTAIGADDVQILGYGIIDGSEEKRESRDCLLPYYPDSDRKSVLKNMISENADKFRSYIQEQNVLRGCIKLYACTNSRVEGVIMRDSSTFALLPAGCRNLEIERVKTIGMWRYNSDGIDLFNCSNVTVRNCFLRNFDDCMVIKGYEGWDGDNNENILVEGCVIWCDWGRALEYGAETNADEYRNIIMRDCDIIHGDCVMMDIQTHNRAEIHHCIFENIRAEYNRYQLPDVLQYDDSVKYEGKPNTEHPLLIAIPVCNDNMYCVKNSHGPVHDILFRDIKIYLDNGVEIPKCFFNGIDENASVSGITIENITVNGKSGIYTESVMEIKDFSKDIVLR